VLYVLTYDITHDASRLRVAELLLGYGRRVQKSVFEADLTPADVQAIRRAVANCLRETDSFRLYPLCGACAARQQHLGAELPPEESLRIV
jgi:CRISPR-associated protein Cas2